MCVLNRSIVIGGAVVLASAGAVTAGGWEDLYVGADIGASFVPRVRIHDVLASDGSGGGKALSATQTETPVGGINFGSQDVAVDLDAGVALNLKLGMKVNDFAAVEIEAGYARNDFSGFESGVWTLPTGDAAITGGTGELTQFPVFVNAKFELPVSKRAEGSALGDMKFNFGAGIGLVSVDGNLSNIGIDDPALAGLTASVDGSSWEPGAQLMAGVSWQLAPNIDLGIGYRLMVVSGANLGKATFSDPAFVGLTDVETGSITSHAVQATLSFEF